MGNYLLERKCRPPAPAKRTPRTNSEGNWIVVWRMPSSNPVSYWIHLNEEGGGWEWDREREWEREVRIGFCGISRISHDHSFTLFRRLCNMLPENWWDDFWSFLGFSFFIFPSSSSFSSHLLLHFLPLFYLLFFMQILNLFTQELDGLGEDGGKGFFGAFSFTLFLFFLYFLEIPKIFLKLSWFCCFEQSTLLPPSLFVFLSLSLSNGINPCSGFRLMVLWNVYRSISLSPLSLCFLIN